MHLPSWLILFLLTFSIDIVMTQALCISWGKNTLVIMIHGLIMIFSDSDQTLSGKWSMLTGQQHLEEHFRIQIHCFFNVLMNSLELLEFLAYSRSRMTTIHMLLRVMKHLVFILLNCFVSAARQMEECL